MKTAFMKKTFVLLMSPVMMVIASTGNSVFGQNKNGDNFFDPLSFGVVLDNAQMKEVIVKQDIVYLHDQKGDLHIDIYLPPTLKTPDKKPAIIFLNAIGENPGPRKVKSWGIYSSWPKLVATYGYIGISMETDGSKIQESINSLFGFIDKHGSDYNIDKDRLGVYAASANVTQSVNYLMGDNAYKGIKAAVLYYGFPPSGPYRKDLPVYLVIAEGDVSPGSHTAIWNEVLKNNAPWTIKMGTAMPHAFDAFSDNDDARKIIKETISFWKGQLDPVPPPTFAHSSLRDALGLLRMNSPKGIELLKTIVAEHPGDNKLLAFYAGVLRDNDKMDEAEEIYKRILQADPNNTSALVALAGMCYVKNKNEEAERYVTTAEQSGQLTANHYGNLGFMLLAAGKNKEAAYYYEKAVALRPNGFDFYKLGSAYAKEGEKDKAFAALNKSLEYQYGSKGQIENDKNLASLRSDSRYQQLIQKIK